MRGPETMRTSPAPPRLPALASRDFRIFIVVQFISLCGTFMQAAVLPYVTYRLTGRPMALGAVGFASALPTLLFTLPAGVVVERLDKRRTVMATQTGLMLLAFALAALVFAGRLGLGAILVVSFASGWVSSVDLVGRQAMLVELVGKEALPSAIAFNAAVTNLTRALGPSLAIPLLALFRDHGEGWAFFGNGVSYLVVLGGLLFVRTTPVAGVRVAEARGRGVGEAVRYLAGVPDLAVLIAMAGVLGFFGMPLSQQLPVLAGGTGAAAATASSALYTALGFGSFLGAVGLVVTSGRRAKGRLLTTAQAVFGLGMVALGVVDGLVGRWLLLALVGAASVTQLALTNTLLQTHVRDELRGRVLGAYFWVLLGAAPFGSLVVGALAQKWGAPRAILVGGACCLALWTAGHVRQPGVRRLRG